jgi:hypothetical protein
VSSFYIPLFSVDFIPYIYYIADGQSKLAFLIFLDICDCGLNHLSVYVANKTKPMANDQIKSPHFPHIYDAALDIVKRWLVIT